MSMKWKERAESESSGFAEKMEVGFHDPVTIIRAMHFKNDGTPMMTTTGKPKLGVVFADDDGKEHFANYFMVDGDLNCEENFGKLAMACGMDIAKLDADGVDLVDFLDNDFASLNLCNRTLGIELVQKGEWINVKPFASRATEAQQEQLPELPADDNEPLDADSIPF